MFSGIIETQSHIKKVQEDGFADQKVIRIFVSRPSTFNDLKIGDSVCTNGVCLTLEKLDADQMQFCLGSETLSILSSSFFQWQQYPVNLERSLKFGDRVHGHLVTGHVDGLGQVVESFKDGECWQLKIKVPAGLKNFLWTKGSVCLNGVSLTVNEVTDDIISVCLIPETILATNLSLYSKDQFLNVEADYLAKAYFNMKAKI